MSTKKAKYSLATKLRATGALTWDDVSTITDIVEAMPVKTQLKDIEVVIDDTGITVRRKTNSTKEV